MLGGKKMKKIITSMAVMAAIFTISGATAFATEATIVPDNLETTLDTICSYCGATCSFVDADGDGICDNYGTYGGGLEVGFVDADGDGICDNYGTYGCGRGGRGRGCGRGRWR